MPEEDKEPDLKQPEAGKAGGSQWAGLLKSAVERLIPLVLTGASLVGFVAFAGAVIVWTRFDAIEVPADQAVKAVPQAELVATGSSVLLIFGLFGVLAIIAAYLIDRSGRATPGMNRALLVLLAIEGFTAIRIFDSKDVAAVIVFALLVALALAATFHRRFARYVDELPPRPSETLGPLRGSGPRRTEARAQREEERLEEARREREAAERERLRRCPEPAEPVATPTVMRRICDCAVRLLAAAKGNEVEKPPPKSQADLEREREAACEDLREKARTAKRRPHRLKVTPLGITLLAVLGALAIAVPSVIVHSRWLAVSLGAAVVLGLGLWRIAEVSRSNFMWYGLMVFLSVPLFGTLTLMAHNIAHPQVQPVALIRSTDGPDEAIQGIYVTEGSDRVYFADVATEGCSDSLTPHGGRLLWVPKSEVVAMSVGPLQGIEDVGKSALEMAYTLTPSVETPAAGALSLTVPERKSKKFKKAEEARELKEAEAQAPSVDDQRLENPGPAVRPNFGTGLTLVPEVASPGEEVELRLSVPNEEVNGFGATPNGHTLRLNGVPLTPIREASPTARQAEYVKTEGGVVLSLEKLGVYRPDGDEPPHALPEGSHYSGKRFVKLDDPRAEVRSGGSARHPEYLEIEPSDGGPTELAGKVTVALKKGKPETLEPVLLRQAWTRNRIRFRVPDNASSGVVTVECDQLASSPLLRVSRAPTARIAVHMRENSTGVKLDSRRSRDGDGEKISRSWTIEGLGRGHRRQVAARFPPRLGAYLVKLTVTDEAGNSDTAELRLLRLPTSLFELKGHPQHRAEVKAAARALAEAVQARRPAAIELDGHTDHSGSPAMNMKLAFERVDRVDEDLLPPRATPPVGELPIPVHELAYGRSCPIDPRIGSRPRNRRVDVFVLDEGVTVKPPKRCVPGRLKKAMWYPRLSPGLGAPSGGTAAQSRP